MMPLDFARRERDERAEKYEDRTERRCGLQDFILTEQLRI
jgi:hypothetical protein